MKKLILAMVVALLFAGPAWAIGPIVKSYDGTIDAGADTTLWDPAANYRFNIRGICADLNNSVGEGIIFKDGSATLFTLPAGKAPVCYPFRGEIRSSTVNNILYIRGTTGITATEATVTVWGQETRW